MNRWELFLPQVYAVVIQQLMVEARCTAIDTIGDEQAEALHAHRRLARTLRNEVEDVARYESVGVA